MTRTQESSAASHKCHFRVRHFGRVFDLPFKNTLGESLHLVHCCISALREKGSAGFEPRPSSSSTSFSARMIPRRSRCHLLLMPSSLPPLPRCSCAVLPHRHRAAPTFPSPLPSDAAALDVAVAAAVAQAVATAVGRHCRRRCHHPRSPYVLFVWCAGVISAKISMISAKITFTAPKFSACGAMRRTNHYLLKNTSILLAPFGRARP